MRQTTTQPGVRGARRAIAAIVVVVATACNSNEPTSSDRTTGTIKVTVSATGVEFPPTYGVRVANRVQYANLGATATLTQIAPGTQQVALVLLSNCKVVGANPREVAVAQGQTSVVSFAVTCVSTTGFVRVTASTVGVDVDTDGYLLTVTGLTQTGQRFERKETVASTGAASVFAVPVGRTTLSLRSVALNCVVSSDAPDPQAVVVQSAETTSVVYAVDCARKGELAYVSYGPDSDIYLVKEDGTGARRLTNLPGRDEDPAWSPDGTRLAFTSDRDGNLEIYTMNADGSDAARLTTDVGADYEPTWSPDGQRIAFVSNRESGLPHIFVMAADGSNPSRLIPASARDYEPAWSPDGQRIAFTTTTPAGRSEIAIVNIDGSDARSLTGQDSQQPAWAPDGSWLAYSASDCRFYYGCFPSIFFWKLTGPDLVRSSQYLVGIRPNWSPDGRKIAFSGYDCDFYFTKCVEGAPRIVRLSDGEMVNLAGGGASPTWRPR